jgi:hypothetical protein
MVSSNQKTLVHSSPQIQAEPEIKKKINKEKVVTTPTKKDFKKATAYEVQSADNSSKYFKGQVQKSVTGDGISVILDDIDLVCNDKTPNKMIPESPEVAPSKRQSSSSFSPPKITYSPPDSKEEIVLLEPQQIVMEELQEDDLDGLMEDVPLDEPPHKATKDKKKQEEWIHKGKLMAKSILPGRSPQKHKEQDVQPLAEAPANKKRVRALFKSKSAVTLTDDSTKASPPKKQKKVQIWLTREYANIYCRLKRKIRILQLFQSPSVPEIVDSEFTEYCNKKVVKHTVFCKKTYIDIHHNIYCSACMLFT